MSPVSFKSPIFVPFVLLKNFRHGRKRIGHISGAVAQGIERQHLSHTGGLAVRRLGQRQQLQLQRRRRKTSGCRELSGRSDRQGGHPHHCDNVFAFQDYMAEDCPLGSEIPEENRVSFLDKIHVPSSVEHIGDSAFKECGWIRSINLPTSLLTIRDNAFYGCWELKQIGMPAKLLSIGDRAFFECFSLEKVRLNKGLNFIGTEAFGFCESLKEITLPQGLVAIGENPFMGCRKLKKIFIPKGTLAMYMEILPESQHRFLKEIQ